MNDPGRVADHIEAGSILYWEARALKAEAEVERLRADLDLQDKDRERTVRGLQNRIGEIQAEVERLLLEHRFQAEATAALLPYQDRAVRAEAEVERLRAEKDELHDARCAVSARDEGARVAAAAIASIRTDAEAWMARAEKAEAELAVAKSFHDVAVKERDYERGAMKPTARELLDIGAQHGDSVPSELASRVEKVLALHREDVGNRCMACGYSWPCPTVRILNGEEA
jgi:hypothetical protein